MEGTVLGGRYRLDSRIAAGGMGEVWRAHDHTLDRTVAVKLMQSQLSADPGFLERFRREARHTAALSHPGIATVYDYGETAEHGTTRAYLVMELIEGHSLHDILGQAGRLPVENTLDLVAQVASALQAAHARGVVHRDVKPANLIVRPDGSVVVTDFGIARSVHAVGHLTVTGEVMGTAAYLAPEQAEGKPASPATDVYSLGVVAYQCLSGRRPFEGGTPVATALAHLRDTPPPLPPDVPPHARAVVERAMAKNPADRFSSAATLAEAARAVLAGRPSAPPPAPVPHPTAPLPAAFASGRATVRPHSAPVSVPPVDPGPDARRSPLVLAGAAAGVVLALLLGFGIAAAMGSGGPDGSGLAGAASSPAAASSSPVAEQTAEPAAQATSAAPSPAPVEQPAEDTFVTLDPADYRGRKVDEVRRDLEALGLKVDEKLAAPTGRPGRVVDVTPTRVRRGDTVTVFVAGEPERDKPKRDKGHPRHHRDDEDQQGDDS